MYSINITQQTQIDTDAINLIVELCSQIPEFERQYSAESIQQRLANQASLLQLIYVEGEIAGFKLGYAINEQTFYSWLGAILPDYRQLGLAQQLLADQEQWAISQGFTQMEVNTYNQFTSMLKMLISHQYQVASVTLDEKNISQNKIKLQKLIAA
ncbi:GNAT family N-acetyltransferase [Shewanella waksmanii]|uniref:GNAT family N-acetyltransferase n=1 Tax=Shewanella waksmanii TaxID=213783 RepID=UPI003735BA98